MCHIKDMQNSMRVPQVVAFDEDVLILIVDDSPDGERVFIQVVTLHIERLVDLMTTEAVDILEKCWKKGWVWWLLAMRMAQVEVENKQKWFSLNDVMDNIKLTKTVRFKPFKTIEWQVIFPVKGHYKWVNTISDPPDHLYSRYVKTIPRRSRLEPGFKRVVVTMTNTSTDEVEIKPKIIIRKTAVANIILPMLTKRVWRETLRWQMSCPLLLKHV